ncbi:MULTISPECIES: hypothetical protein [unclassified Crossiella]|uniref:hypothetical protein n=1 Tax=unclassified Crossiella TaxID=2620835 RepID=UPI001FFE4F42|nr:MULTISPECIES: hypothetical protein [unclassified Crossiella]MCK2237732.1 hypothetical protein [Crossiella sp. S99.2]MCK2255018.1 hypothetical protein [Crossiella sp. S99.1]
MSSPHTTDTTPTATGARRAVARLATEILAPWVWVLGLPLVVAWQATGHQFGATLLWGLIVGVTGSVVPMIVIVRGAKKGAWDGHHVTNREGRIVPFAACIGSLAVGWVALILGDAPHQMISLAAAMLLTLVVSLLITFGAKYKVSLHGAVAAGAVVILAVVYNPWALVLTLLVVWVNWSRVVLRDHTTGQVLLGTVVGLIAGGGGYWVLEQMLG